MSSQRSEFATAQIHLGSQALANVVASVHSTLASIHGVYSVSVSMEEQEANVHFDLHKVHPLQFKRALFIIGIVIDTMTLTFDKEDVISAQTYPASRYR